MEFEFVITIYRRLLHIKAIIHVLDIVTDIYYYLFGYANIFIY